MLGEASGIWDADSQFAPYQMLVGDFARAGRFLLWNPWDNGGSPDGFEPQFGAFSPLTTGLGLLFGGRELAFRAYWLLVWFAGGLGLLRLGRHLGAPAWGATVVALGFLFSGLYTGHAQATPFLVSASALPWVVWRADVALATGSTRAAAQAGALLGLSALSGHPAFTVATSAFVLLWAGGRRLTTEDDGPWRPSLARTAAILGSLFAVALVVLAPAYLGFLHENVGFTFKTGPLPRSVVTQSNVLEPGALASFASPSLLVLKAANRSSLWPRTDPSSCSVYLTALVTSLGVAALLTSTRRRWRLWLLAVGFLFLLAALAEPVPVRGWLYDLVPPTRYFRHAAVFRVYSMFVVAVLALLATRDVDRAGGEASPGLWMRVAVVAAALAAAAALSVARVEGALPAAGPEPGLAHAHAALAWLGTVALGLWGWRAGRRVPLAALAVALAAADALGAGELGRWVMYRPAERWRPFEEHRSSSLDLLGRGPERVPRLVFDGMLDNKNLVLKLPVLHSYSALENAYHQGWVEDPALVAVATGRRRTWFSPAVAMVVPDDRSWAAFRERARALGAPPLVVHEPAAMLGTRPGNDQVARIAALPAVVPIDVDIRAYEPDRLVFSVAAPSDGWVWVTDRWARSWRATVNGWSVPVQGANFVFRAVRVPAGRNEVAFEYRPAGHPWLVLVSWATLAAVAAWTLAALRAARPTGT